MSQLTLIERTAMVQVLLEELDDLEQLVGSSVAIAFYPLADFELQAKAISQLFEDTDTDAAAQVIAWQDLDPDDPPPWRNAGTMRTERTDDRLLINFATPGYDLSTYVRLADGPSGEPVIILNDASGPVMQSNLTQFSLIWKNYLLYVPAAVASCGAAGLRFLSRTEAMTIAGDKWSLVNGEREFYLLAPMRNSKFYDPIDVARAVAMFDTSS